MHVDRSMIHPDLRVAGVLFRALIPAFTECTFRLARAAGRPLKGRCRAKLRYAQEYIPRADGSLLRVCVYSPLSPKANVPGLLWLHGGGYATGTPEQDESYIRRFIEASGCVAAAPDYRLSLDAPYPAALEDCYAALLWLREHGRAYGMRPDQIMVGGQSAGGGLAAALCLYARDRGEVALAFQMPLYPMLDDRMNTPSATDNDAPLWGSKSSYTGWKLYLGELFGACDVPAYAAPARAKDFCSLPPACTFAGGIEPFRDETAAYVEQLRACGIPVRFKLFEGCFHGFDVVCPKTGIAREAVGFLMDGFRYAAEHYFAQQPSGSGG